MTKLFNDMSGKLIFCLSITSLSILILFNIDIDEKLISVIVGLASLFIALFHCILIRKDNLSSPLGIHILSWFPTFVTGLFFYDDYLLISFKTILIWLIWFWFVYLFIEIFSPNRKLEINKVIPINFDYSLILFIVIILFTRKIYFIASSGLADPGVVLRMANTGKLNDPLFSLGVFSYLQPLLMTLLFWEYATLRNGNRLRFVLLSILSFMFFIGSMSKFNLIKPLIGLILLRNLKEPINIKFLITILFAISVIFYIMQIFRTSAGGNSLSIGDTFGLYLYAPLVAFGQVVDGNLVLDKLSSGLGSFTFRFIYAVSYFLGITNIPPNVNILPFTSVPVIGNIYTVMFGYFLDFGTIGVAILAIVFGSLIGIIYRFAINKRGGAICYYLGMLQLLYMESTGESLFTVFSANLQLLFWCYAVDKIVNKGSKLS